MIPTGRFWGKLDREAGSFHPLEDHCLDVAVVFRRLLELPAFQRTCSGELNAAQRDRLAVIAFLHDVGKCNWGFQAKSTAEAKETAGHVFEAAALLFDPPPQAIASSLPKAWNSLLMSLCGWFCGGEEEAVAMLFAAISHHGRPVSENDLHSAPDRNLWRWWAPQSGVDPMPGLSTLAEEAQRAFPGAFQPGIPPIHATAGLQQRFAGLLMLADWIASDAVFFPFRSSPGEDRRTLAQEAARRALQAIGLNPGLLREPRPFEECFGFSPTPLQSRIAEAFPPGESNRLLLIESETGSGKTEAALAWFFRLLCEGHVDGLYFALPTRVAARELYARVLGATERAFASIDNRPSPVLLAVPGYVKADGEPVLPDPGLSVWEDEGPSRSRERVWAAERPKRFLAAPIAVGTIDQALLSVLQVKHSLLRSVCLDRHLLVVDEVHASDPYMREILQALLDGHVARGGWALLLSATLGDAARCAFFHTDPMPLEEAKRRSYPSVTTLEGECAIPPHTVSEKEVRLEPIEALERDELLVEPLREAIRHGAKILVVCNTVDRANRLLRRMEDAETTGLFIVGGTVCPHHGRFAREDRVILDAEVSARFGKGSSAGPLVLIGTQTLEQSLDIDADWLITDLCPMDVLLQRIGRLHRHAGRRRPSGFEAPRVWVRVPENPSIADMLRPDGSLHGPAGLGRVYGDGRVLQRTLDILRKRPVWRIPTDNRSLVEEATHPEALRRLPDKWRPHDAWIEGTLLTEVRQASAGIMKEIPFGQLHYPDKGERVVTRLGLGTLDLPLEAPVLSPFGQTIHRVLIPAHLLPPNVVNDESLRAEPFRDGFRTSLGPVRYRYTRFGLEKEDA